MKHVVITGANGFIGSQLINRLVKMNVKILAIDTSFKNTTIYNSNLVTKKILDLNDEIFLEDNIPHEDYDAFYHFAWSGVNGTDKANPIVQLKNIEIMIKCASLAKNIGCKKFLCSGSIAEQSANSLSFLKKTEGGMMYGASKYCAHIMLETYCKNIELDFVWMQFSNIYGPGNCTGNLISYTLDRLSCNEEAIFGPALQPYDFIYIDDLIEAVVCLGQYQTKNNFYFIGSGQPRILKDYLLYIGDLLQKTHLIKLGIRPDDNIKYSLDMFDIKPLIDDIGDYVSTDFENGLAKTIESL